MLLKEEFNITLNTTNTELKDQILSLKSDLKTAKQTADVVTARATLFVTVSNLMPWYFNPSFVSVGLEAYFFT